MPGQKGWIVVGVDNGGTANNGTALDAGGGFLIDRMAEIPSYVRQGPDKAIRALVDSVDNVLDLVAQPRSAVRAVGLDTPGPASATGVLSSRGATNFASPEWWGFDIRGALEELPPDQRQVIELAYFGGFSHSQIATMLELPAGTVKGRMRLGLTKLRLALGDPSGVLL